MYDICCIGHVTLDKVVTTRSEMHMAGGTAFYFSSALENMDARYLLVTSVAESEIGYVDALREKGTEIWSYPSAYTVYFENIYGENQDNRTQNVLQQADPFTVEQLRDVDASVFHLGPLLAGDISVELIKFLSSKGKVSLDVQGYLRKVEDQKVRAVSWTEKCEALQYVDILKADEAELRVLTGAEDIQEGVKLVTEWGVREAVITDGSLGSAIYAEGIFYKIPAYPPDHTVDATGCGDTYMAGYLYQRAKGVAIQQAGEFAAAMASLKMESPGPFTGTEQEVLDRLGRT